jgi:DNA mismatch endonuclease, patch repair protein
LIGAGEIMADVHSRETRSYNMSRIRSENTKQEMIVRKALHANGFRYRLHDKSLPGRPDIILKKYKTIIFVNGCFWHGHKKCKYFKMPETRTDWWTAKIARTKERDVHSIKQLTKLGWNIIVIFECKLKDGKKEATINKLIDKLR